MSFNAFRVRKFFTWLHRWFGLIAGFHFVLLGLTGSWLTYEDEIEGLLKPELRNSAAADPQPSWSEAIEAARTGLKTTKSPTSLVVPEGPSKNIIVSFDMAEPGEPRRMVRAYVDPTRTEFRGQDVYRATLSGQLFAFHHDLFWGRTGRTIMAVSGTLMVLLLATGLWIWWPLRLSGLLAALKMKKTRSASQLNLELHKLSGVYTIVLMVVVTATGVVISRPDWFVASAGASRPGGGPDAQKEKRDSGAPDFKMIEARARTLGFVGRPLQIRVDSRGGTLTVVDSSTSKRETLSLFDSPAPPKPQAQGSGSKFRAINHDLHVGHFWGEIGRALIFLSGVMPLFFYVTGVYVWWKKRKAHA